MWGALSKPRHSRLVTVTYCVNDLVCEGLTLLLYIIHSAPVELSTSINNTYFEFVWTSEKAQHISYVFVAN